MNFFLFYKRGNKSSIQKVNMKDNIVKENINLTVNLRGNKNLKRARAKINPFLPVYLSNQRRVSIRIDLIGLLARRAYNFITDRDGRI